MVLTFIYMFTPKGELPYKISLRYDLSHTAQTTEARGLPLDHAKEQSYIARGHLAKGI